MAMRGDDEATYFALDQFQKLMSNAETVNQVKVGDLVATYSEPDSIYMRAIVINVRANNVDLVNIDFGFKQTQVPIKVISGSNLNVY